MNATPPTAELIQALGRAELALSDGNTEAANGDMAAAADLCRRLQAAGFVVPARELALLRDLADKCGLALKRLGQDLNAESFRDDNHRRGLEIYQASQRR